MYEHEPPYRGLEARGEARLLQDGIVEAVSSMAARYLGEEQGAAYAATVSADDTVLVRLEPTQVRGWDFADDWPTDA